MIYGGTAETTEDLTDQIIRTYEDVRQEVGDDPTGHPDQRDRVEPFLPVMVESLHQDGVDVTPSSRQWAAEVSAAEARYHEALLLGHPRAHPEPSLDG